MEAQGSVEVLTGWLAGSRYPLTAGRSELTVGADPTAGVVVPGDPGMAPLHFRVILEPGFCLVESLGEEAVLVDGRRVISTAVEECGTVQAGTTLFEVRFRPAPRERAVAVYGFAAVTALREAGERCWLVAPEMQAGEWGLLVLSVEEQEAEAAELLAAGWGEDRLSVWVGEFGREELLRHLAGMAELAGGAEGLQGVLRPQAQLEFVEGFDAAGRAGWFGPAQAILVEAGEGEAAVVMDRDGGRRWVELGF